MPQCFRAQARRQAESRSSGSHSVGVFCLMSGISPMRTVLTGFVLWCGLTLTLVAQVPHLITYQGRVNSGGQAFSGTGRFKFALVGNSGTPVFWRNDGAGGAGEPAVA